MRYPAGLVVPLACLVSSCVMGIIEQGSDAPSSPGDAILDGDRSTLGDHGEGDSSTRGDPGRSGDSPVSGDSLNPGDPTSTGDVPAGDGGVSSSVVLSGPDGEGYLTITVPVSEWSAGSSFGPAATLLLFDDFQRHTPDAEPDFLAPLIGAWDGYGSLGGGTNITDEGNGNLAFPIVKETGSASNLLVSFAAETSFLLSWNTKLPTHTMPRVATPYTYIADTSAQFKSVWKMTWVTYELSAESDNDWDGCFPSWIPSPIFGGNDFVNTWYTGAGGALDFDDWGNWTVAMVSQADPLANQDIMLRTVSPAHGLSESRTNDRSFFSAGHSAQAFTDVRLPGWIGNGEGAHGQAWYDNIYLAVGANAFARIELGNAPRYDDCTELWAMPFVSWTASEIQAKVHGTSLATGTTKYLYVHDRDQNHNANGIAVTRP